MPDKTLLHARIDQIQSYLLTTPRLWQIRGGSHLLVDIELELKKQLTRLSGHVACAAGGLLLAVFDDETKARQGLELVRRTLPDRAPAARFTASTSPWKEGQEFPDALRRALQDREPEAPEETTGGFQPPPDLPHVMPCDICATRPARRTLRHAGQQLRACVDCIARDVADRDDLAVQDPGWKRLIDRLDAAGVLIDEPEGAEPTITDISRGGHPRNYLGYVAADGNAIGDELDKLHTPEEYEDFSTKLNAATQDALGTAVETCVTRPAWRSLRDSKLLPCIAGGDDLLLFTSPALAVPLAVEFAKAFERATERTMQRRLTTGIGVIIAHATTPFGALDEAAHRLQKKAKARSRVRGGSAIAFQVLRTGAAVGREQVRDGYHAGVGWYELGDCASLVDLAFRLTAKKPPWSRLQQVDTLLRRDDPAANDDFEVLLSARSMAEVAPILREALRLPSGSEYTGADLWRKDGDDYVSALPDLLALAKVV